MGYLGKPAHPEAEAKAVEGIKRIRGAGKPAGVFARNAEDARNKIAAGASFVSLGTDIGLLAAACRQLVASVDRVDAAPPPTCLSWTRSDERRVGQAWFSTFRSRGWREH